MESLVLVDKLTLLLTQAAALIAVLAAICGIVATALPQQWRLTKALTKIGMLTVRATTAPSPKNQDKLPPIAGASIVFLALFLSGCAGTLEETRASVRVQSVAGVRTTRDADLCDSLSSKQFWSTLVGAVCAGGASTTAGFLAWEVDPSPTERKALAYATGASGLCALGAVAAVQWLSGEWVRKECAQ
jgi:hypothetical protein